MITWVTDDLDELNAIIRLKGSEGNVFVYGTHPRKNVLDLRALALRLTRFFGSYTTLNGVKPKR